MSVALAMGVGMLSGVPSPATAQARAGVADRAFIDFMVPHHQSASMMAEDAVARAGHPKLKAHARRMREQHAREIAQMKEWRAQWFGSADTPPPMRMRDIPPGVEEQTGDQRRLREWLREWYGVTRPAGMPREGAHR